ncbi:MAG: PTS sugar transporter subunit IIA [Candidatus Omnitrophica bacterium]|nr:PTS sugar transporter subunit IIA [Candidatus Omnitrophota bacterium]
MKTMEFLSKKAISTDLKSTNKPDVIKELVELLADAGEIERRDKNKLIDILMAREALGSTAIGQGVGIPHGKSDCVKKLVAAFGISKKGVNFDSLDGEPVYIFFLLVAPQNSAGPHLKALARISRLLKDKYFRENLKQAQDDKAVIRIMNQEDERKA